MLYEYIGFNLKSVHGVKISDTLLLIKIAQQCYRRDHFVHDLIEFNSIFQFLVCISIFDHNIISKTFVKSSNFINMMCLRFMLILWICLNLFMIMRLIKLNYLFGQK